MDKDCATIVIATCARAARELGDMAGILDEDDQAINIAIATIIYDIMQNVIDPIQNTHLDLRTEIDGRLERYGRAF
jgi:hypothetical protein